MNEEELERAIREQPLTVDGLTEIARVARGGRPNEYCDYAYQMDNRPFSLEGIRQHIKMWHFLALTERYPDPVGVLDVGCGACDVLRTLRNNDISFSYLGLDVKPHFNEDLFVEGERNSFVQIDLSRYSFKSASELYGPFDIVVMYDLLQNVRAERAELLLRNAHDCMRPSGTLTISTRNSRMAPDSDRDHHLIRWGVGPLVDLARDVGFELQTIRGVNFGEDESAIRSSGYDFLPKRVRRTVFHHEHWSECKYVMMDLGKEPR